MGDGGVMMEGRAEVGEGCGRRGLNTEKVILWCVCVCVCVRVRACVRACVCV